MDPVPVRVDHCQASVGHDTRSRMDVRQKNVNTDSQEECRRFSHFKKSFEDDFKKRLKKSRERAQERSKKIRKSTGSMVSRDEEHSKKIGESTEIIVDRGEERSKKIKKITGIEGVLHEKVGLSSVSNGKDRLENAMDDDLTDYFENFIDLEDDVNETPKAMTMEWRSNERSLNTLTLKINRWCHDNGYVRSGLRVSKLACSKKSGTLNLEQVFETDKRVYDQSQTQKGKPFSYVEVVVHQNDNNSKSKEYLQALMKMEMPVYMALSDPPRLQKVVDVQMIPWKELIFQSECDLIQGKTSMTSLSEIVSGKHDELYLKVILTNSEIFKERLSSLSKNQKILLCVHGSKNLEWLVEYLSRSPLSIRENIHSLQLSKFDIDSFMESKELLIKLFRLCIGMEIYSHLPQPSVELEQKMFEVLIPYLPMSIKKLNLSFCDMTMDQVKVLSENMPSNLEILDLSHIRIDEDSLVFLFPFLPSSLWYLNLSHKTASRRVLEQLECYLPENLTDLKLFGFKLRDATCYDLDLCEFRERHGDIEFEGEYF